MEAFKAKWNFPNCCGAVDGKHCQMKRLDYSCSEFYNYKRTYITILFALVYVDCRFVFIDVVSNGRVNTLRTGLLNFLNARSRGLTFRHRASCI